jgi:hypothetical protein
MVEKSEMNDQEIERGTIKNSPRNSWGILGEFLRFFCREFVEKLSGICG